MSKAKVLISVGVVAALLVTYHFKQTIKQYLIDIHAVDVIATVKNFGETDIGKEDVIAKLKYKKMPLVVNKLDRCVCLNIRVRGAWEHQFADKIISLVNDGDTVIEIGANYGVYTIPFLDRVGNAGKVYAYEANPLVYKSLLKSYALNEFNNNELFNLAVSNYNGKAKIRYNYQNLGGASITNVTSSDNTNNNSYTVDTVILDEHLSSIAQANMIKIDAEGSEINIIPTAEKIIDRSPNMILAMEWSPEQMSTYNQDVPGFAQFLLDKGFKILELNLDGSISKLQKEDLLVNKHRELLLYKPNAEPLLLSKIGQYIN